jgi:Tfp pilus assembly protein PilF
MVSCLAQMLGDFLLAFVLTLFQGNATNGVIRGQILVPSVSANERIPITVQRTDGPIVARIFSDSQGNYEVRGLPVGGYDVIVNVEGYEDVRQQVGIGGGPFNTVILNIPLREKEKIIIVKPDRGDADDVVDIAELGRKYPKKAVQDYEKARDELRKGNDAKAIDLLVSVVKLAPDFYNAHNTLGTVYQKNGRFREAEPEYRRASVLNPRTAEPLINLGSMFIDEASARQKEGKAVVGKILDDALDVIEASLKLNRSPMAYYYLGTAYFRSNFYEEAETNLKLALEMDPRLPPGHLMLANLYLRQRKWREALEQLDKYLQENPKAANRAGIEQTRASVAERIR